jgi:hypothetical protein
LGKRFVICKDKPKVGIAPKLFFAVFCNENKIFSLFEKISLLLFSMKKYL